MKAARRSPPREAPVWLEPLPVARWMRKPVLTVRPDTTAREAAELMRVQRVRHLPVTDQTGRLMGIVTDRDLRQVIFDRAVQERLGELAAVLETLPVAEVMTWGVVAVRPDTDLRHAARVMRERKVGALPIVDDGRLVGILTERDVLRVLESLLRQRLKRVRPATGPAEAGAYDPGVSAPGNAGEEGD